MTGYLYRLFDFIVYVGKGTQIRITLPDVDEEKQSHSTKVVLSLIADLLDKRSFLGIDNYYSSVFLFDYLALHKTDVIGTIRKKSKRSPPKSNPRKIENMSNNCHVTK